jgi:hypothetical protein
MPLLLADKVSEDPFQGADVKHCDIPLRALIPEWMEDES